jgi:HD-GYP domain-containing protein (c-di-GMP phosphodiesterase class II)
MIEDPSIKTIERINFWNSLRINSSLSERLKTLGEKMQQQHPDVHRFSVALYDQNTDELKSFFTTSFQDEAIFNYQSKLERLPSLKKIITHYQPRVINDLPKQISDKNIKHNQSLIEQGWKSSYTVPMYFGNEFLGFIFFNSKIQDAFTQSIIHGLDILSQVITLFIHNERAAIRTLVAAVRSALLLTNDKDPETGSHLERTAHYSRMIARELLNTGKYDFSDQTIEHIFLFAPVHDIGKIAIPDSILQKPGKLTAEEFQIMKTHTTKGSEIVSRILANHGLDTIDHVHMLQNIVHYHHEAVDGSGYPKGLRGNEIPIEARIVSVADVFDALTSVRPYKEAWSNEKAASYLIQISGQKLDPDCVQALLTNFEDIEYIQSIFNDQ